MKYVLFSIKALCHHHRPSWGINGRHPVFADCLSFLSHIRFPRLFLLGLFSAGNIPLW